WGGLPDDRGGKLPDSRVCEGSCVLCVVGGEVSVQPVPGVVDGYRCHVPGHGCHLRERQVELQGNSDRHQAARARRGPAASDRRLLAGQYTSVATRQSLFETAADMGIQDSVRMWLAAGATFPYSKKTIAPFVYDLAGATWSMFSTRNTRLLNPSTGQPITGGTLNIGNRVQFVSPWVPWGPSGFSFLYDVLPYYDFTDPGVFPDPHTGLYIPIRAAFDVTTQGPTGNMAVPSTAYWFDAGSNGLGGWNN